MNGAQRAAFVEMVTQGNAMASVMYEIAAHRDPIDQKRFETLMHLQRQWLNARNRYFELEAEARNAKSSARKSRGAIARKRGVQS